MQNRQVQLNVLRESAASAVNSQTAAPYVASFASCFLELFVRITVLTAGVNIDFILESSADADGAGGWAECARIAGAAATGTFVAVALRGEAPMGRYLRLRWAHNAAPASVTFEARLVMG